VEKYCRTGQATYENMALAMSVTTEESSCNSRQQQHIFLLCKTSRLPMRST